MLEGVCAHLGGSPLAGQLVLAGQLGVAFLQPTEYVAHDASLFLNLNSYAFYST